MLPIRLFLVIALATSTLIAAVPGLVAAADSLCSDGQETTLHVEGGPAGADQSISAPVAPPIEACFGLTWDVKCLWSQVMADEQEVCAPGPPSPEDENLTVRELQRQIPNGPDNVPPIPGSPGVPGVPNPEEPPQVPPNIEDLPSVPALPEIPPDPEDLPGPGDIGDELPEEVPDPEDPPEAPPEGPPEDPGLPDGIPPEEPPEGPPEEPPEDPGLPDGIPP